MPILSHRGLPVTLVGSARAATTPMPGSRPTSAMKGRTIASPATAALPVHYGGQCSNCHNTNAWQPANFSHEGQNDCQSCHSRPSGHYGGQCSNCHNTNAWEPANFSHEGQTDCQSCHSRPAGHWAQQCSRCHNTNNWSDIHVDGHSFSMNHGGAGGNCSTCHQANTPAYTCYGCHDRQETEQHHAEEGITDIDGRCTECHQGGGD